MASPEVESLERRIRELEQRLTLFEAAIKVRGDTVELVGNNISIRAGSHVQISAGTAMTLDAGVKLTIDTGHDLSATVGHSFEVNASSLIALHGGGNLSLKSGGDTSILAYHNFSIDTTKIALEADTAFRAQSGGNFEILADKQASLITGDEISMKAGDGSITVKKDGTESFKGKTIHINGSGNIDIHGNKVVVKGAGGVNLNGQMR